MRATDNKGRNARACRWIRAFAVAWLAALPLAAHAQLAITEVMSSPSTNCGITHPDFWELTNFGTNTVNLTGYRFWDEQTAFHAAPQFDIFIDPPIIAPGESILLVRQGTGITNAVAFKLWWWGTATTNVRIFFYGLSPGLDADNGETIWLWDSNGNVIDAATFGPAVLDKGITFIRDPATGELAIPSEPEQCGAFRAVNCDDVGSPGTALCDRVPLSITREPLSQAVDAGSEATLRVSASGLPRPNRYQWYKDGMPKTNATTTSEGMPPLLINLTGCGLAWETLPSASDLTIKNVQPSDAGQYFVSFWNGMEAKTSAVVTLTVNTNPMPPVIECSPDALWLASLSGARETNLSVSPGQPVNFQVPVRGYPSPTFQWAWSADGKTFTSVSDATNRTFSIPYAEPSTAGIYRVTVQNSLGKVEAETTLAVTPKPLLRITEAMGYPANPEANDWWELTNTGSDPVNLTGYRWNDSPGELGGPTITNAVVIEPGESIIFLESRTAEFFKAWWGGDNLPPKLKFIVYGANGITETSDEIKIWNHSAVAKNDAIDSVVLSNFPIGTSFWFDGDACLVWSVTTGILSSNGTCGTFISSAGTDVGSPGWTQWTPPIVSGIRRNGGTNYLQWEAQPGSSNRLQYTIELAGAATVWNDLGEYSFAGATGMATDAIPEVQQRFYRVVRSAPANCPCPPPPEL